MITPIATIQEITLQAYEFGTYNYLADKLDMSRDEIFNVFEEWGKEFNKAHENYNWNGDYYEEIDAFLYRKRNELELEDKFSGKELVGKFFKFEGGVYKITGFSDRGILVDEIISSPKNEGWITTEIGASQFEKIEPVPYFEEIMNTTNNHNEELVRKINLAWNEKREEFYPILTALYLRDIEEITDADSFQIPEWRNWTEYEIGMSNGDWSLYLDAVYAEMQTKWKDYAENYLMHIADDWDLKAILYFLRYEA